MRRFLCVCALALAVCMIVAGCGNGSGSSNSTIAVTISNKLIRIAPSAAAVTLNVVTNDPKGVTFALTANGVVCAPDCGALSGATATTVIYTPPASIPASPNNAPTVKATSVTASTVSDSDGFTIEIPVSNVDILNGQYAFVVSGFDASGLPMSMAGSLTADGLGHITGGEMDVNDNLTVTKSTSALAGTYTLDEDLRGIITLTTVVPGVTSAPAFSFTVDSDGFAGDVISLDANQFAASGFFQLQDSSIFNAGATIRANPVPAATALGNLKSSSSGPVRFGVAVIPGLDTGNFVFRWSSDAPNPDRVGAVGRLVIVADGSVTGLLDAAEAFGGNPVFTDASITGAATGPDANGRGTLSVSTGSGAPLIFATYTIDKSKFYLLEIDGSASGNNVIFSGVARSQSTPFTNGSVSGTSAFGMLGGDYFDTNIFNGAPEATNGQLVIAGTTATVTSDQNAAGITFNGPNTNTGNVTFDLNSGRGTITISGGFDSGFFDDIVFYLESGGKGVLLDTTPLNPGFDSASVGDFSPQSGSPFGSSSISGNVMGVDSLSTDPTLPSFVTALAASGGALSGFADAFVPGVSAFTNQKIAGSYANVNASTGRATVTVPAAVFGFPGTADAVLYLVSPNQFYLIAVNNGGTPTKPIPIESTLGVFDPQMAVGAAARPLLKGNAGQMFRIAESRKSMPGSSVNLAPGPKMRGRSNPSTPHRSSNIRMFGITPK